MRLTAKQLNRATLQRQLLLRREPVGVADAAHRIVALQAQEAASPYLALWNRVEAFDPAELDAAFAGQSVIKATLMRITLHAVGAGDYPAFRAAMVRSLRASRLGDRRFTSAGLSIAEVDALVPDVLAFAAGPHTNAEFEAMLAERLGAAAAKWVWWAMRTFAPVVHAPTGGSWSFGPRPSYVAGPTAPSPADHDESAVLLARRYLEGFGPASAADLARFSLLTRAKARDALHAVDGAELFDGPDGAVLFDVPGAPLPGEDTPAPPRLMAMWDSILLAYADRSRVIPPDYRKLVIRNNGDVLPTLLVDGHVAGVWRPAEGGIEVTAFHPLPDEAWGALADEASALVAFLVDRDPTVYRRYGHWWATLPTAEIRVLSG